MAECRHGFDEGLCDICFPRQQEEAAPRSAPVRTKSSPLRQPASRSRAAAKAPEDRVPAVPLVSRRIFHVTHVDNLPGIIADGALRADAEPQIDLLAPAARAQRNAVEVVPGASLGEFVSFSLNPQAAWWNAVRGGAVDERWSAAAREQSLLDFVVLVGTVAAVGPEIVVSTGDASHVLSRFGLGLDAAGAIVRRAAVGDPDLVTPEVLVRGSYPLGEIVSIAHPNEPLRQRVKGLLSEAGGAQPRLAVFPPYFQSVEGDEE